MNLQDSAGYPMPAKPAPELTSQEWELRRKERAARQWAARRARWAAYKKAQNYLRGA